jgi:hypothetical protein
MARYLKTRTRHEPGAEHVLMSHGIVAPMAERVTAENPPPRHYRPPKRAVLAERIDGIVRTTRVKLTRSRQERRQDRLIRTHQRHEELSNQDVRCSS